MGDLQGLQRCIVRGFYQENDRVLIQSKHETVRLVRLLQKWIEGQSTTIKCTRQENYKSNVLFPSGKTKSKGKGSEKKK